MVDATTVNRAAICNARGVLQRRRLVVVVVDKGTTVVVLGCGLLAHLVVLARAHFVLLAGPLSKSLRIVHLLGVLGHFFLNSAALGTDSSELLHKVNLLARHDLRGLFFSGVDTRLVLG